MEIYILIVIAVVFFCICFIYWYTLWMDKNTKRYSNVEKTTLDLEPFDETIDFEEEEVQRTGLLIDVI